MLWNTIETFVFQVKKRAEDLNVAHREGESERILLLPKEWISGDRERKWYIPILSGLSGDWWSDWQRKCKKAVKDIQTCTRLSVCDGVSVRSANVDWDWRKSVQKLDRREPLLDANKSAKENYTSKAWSRFGIWVHSRCKWVGTIGSINELSKRSNVSPKESITTRSESAGENWNSSPVSKHLVNSYTAAKTFMFKATTHLYYCINDIFISWWCKHSILQAVLVPHFWIIECYE